MTEICGLFGDTLFFLPKNNSFRTTSIFSPPFHLQDIRMSNDSRIEKVLMGGQWLFHQGFFSVLEKVTPPKFDERIPNMIFVGKGKLPFKNGKFLVSMLDFWGVR